MAWSTPLTAVSNSALTAAQWNASVRDNLLETGPAKITSAGQHLIGTAANAQAARSCDSGRVDTPQGTTSAAFVDLATSGPAAAGVTGSRCWVFISCGMSSNAIGGFANMSYAISGATTVAAGTTLGAVQAEASAVNRQVTVGGGWLETGLNAGTNTFTAKYSAGSAGGTATFFNRRIAIFPL
jgi:hypothetical protein